MLSVDCRISGHHPSQGPARQAERQRGDKMGRAAGEALVHRQGNDGQDGEIEKAADASPEEFACFHHFSLQEAAQKAGDDIDGDDADVDCGF